MGRPEMRVGILTSSRADYGIYKPLLQTLNDDPFFDLSILAFGAHLSKQFGYTIHDIEKDKYRITAKLDTIPSGDTPEDIAFSMGKTISAFSRIWGEKKYDIVFALGDRSEMFAAVSSALPFNICIAHIHGGETTLGAIDNAFRHSITSMADFHFTATEQYKQRVIDILGDDNNVYNVGALSIDNIRNLSLLSIKEFNEKFDIDLSYPSILITVHPETVHPEKNIVHIIEFIKALRNLNQYQLIITMPNADTMGLYLRKELKTFIDKTPNVIGIENLGTKGYLSCMKHCRIVLGNSSSGFIEAKGLNKPVVNVGDRQKGRILTDNIFPASFNEKEILDKVNEAKNYIPSEINDIYGTGNAAYHIISILKEISNETI